MSYEISIEHSSATPLRKIRWKKNLSLQDVCLKVGIDNGHLFRIERGEQTSPDLAERLSNFYNDEISEIEILYSERFINIEE